MAVNQERIVSVTAHHTGPAYTKIIYVPAHFSLAETRKAIHSTISKHLATEGALALKPDLSSIIIASGEFLQHRLCPLTIKNHSKGSGAYEANTPIGKIASENDFVIHAIVPTVFNEAAEMLQALSFETKKAIKVNSDHMLLAALNEVQ